MKLYLGDCLEVMKTIPDNSVDSIVTDPPYGLSFMGKKWDYDVPSIEIWKEALRVLKPGGHLLSFGGTRTYHRLVVNIEDAGFEIRDCIQWLYGSGFPKSHNIKDGDYKGWGTALKPANEPICVARKPLEKGLTVAQNVLKWGCGGINIDASRIGMLPGDKKGEGGNLAEANVGSDSPFNLNNGKFDLDMQSKGRWPANIILDEEAAMALDEQSGVSKSPTETKVKNSNAPQTSNSYGKYSDEGRVINGHGDSGGASRFFYVAKASKGERNKGCDVNNHPTVKPIKLMEYLIKLVTPLNGTVLDPFMGSGSTGVGASNFNFIGIEKDENYFKIAQERIVEKPLMKGAGCE